MTSFSEDMVVTPERALDSMFIVYATLEGHPAGPAVEQLLRGHSGWATLPVCLLEAYSILVKVYATDSVVAHRAIAAFAAGPLVVVPMDGDDALAAQAAARPLGVDLTDALLLHACSKLSLAHIATDDGRLIRAAEARGLLVANPIGPALREAISRWEDAHLPAKGLPRMLRTVGSWVEREFPQASESFRNATGGYSHLP